MNRPKKTNQPPRPGSELCKHHIIRHPGHPSLKRRGNFFYSILQKTKLKLTLMPLRGMFINKLQNESSNYKIHIIMNIKTIFLFSTSLIITWLTTSLPVTGINLVKNPGFETSAAVPEKWIITGPVATMQPSVSKIGRAHV